MTRSYRQYCAIARALDRVGDRWTLLIIRELTVGPKRFKDLMEGLPGISTNLLSDRLGVLSQEGIVRRAVLGPPAGVQVYELTETGVELEPVLVALARWGHRYLTARTEDDFANPAWAVLALRSRFHPEEAEGVRETYEFRFDDTVMHVRVDDGTVRTGQGVAEDPDLVLVTDGDTLLALGAQQISAEEAVAAGRLEVRGPREMLERMGRIFRPYAAGE